MAILRDTRARIDPGLLAAMKDHLSAIMPQQAMLKPDPAAPVVPPAPKAAQPLKEGVFKREYAEAPQPVPVADDRSGTEPVDKQKIAQIVLQYMKNREDKIKH